MSKMIETLQNAPAKKAKTEKMITRFSRIYTPIVVALAAIIAFVFPLIFTDVSSTTWIHRSLIFLVASCPCALVVSVPLSYFAGLGKASKEQILVKAASHFEEALNIKNIYFDKTGTITKGNFTVTHQTNSRALYLAALLEQYSKHPIALAILEANQKPLVDTITRFREISGQGLAGIIEGKTIYVGNEKLMMNQNIDYTENTNIGSIVYVALDNEFIGSIVIADEIKETSASAISNLSQNYTLSILSGDNENFVSRISNTVGITSYHASLYPEDKLNIVKQDKEPKMVIGDGINDALVLQEADLGVAMGQLGSDIAIETADIVLANDDLQQLDTFFKISKKTHHIVIQNITLALVVKSIVLLLGTLGLTNMIVAVFADVGVTLLAVLNALRTMR
jgi:Cd2+/Zn2+-exporting ATPase